MFARLRACSALASSARAAATTSTAARASQILRSPLAVARGPTSGASGSLRSVSRLKRLPLEESTEESPDLLDDSDTQLAYRSGQNLNDRLQCVSRLKCIQHESQGTVRIFFDNISQQVAAAMHEVPYVVGCMAWLSDPLILDTLASLKGASIVVTNDTRLNQSRLRERYSKIKGLSDRQSAIRCVGFRTGGVDRALMHHKFLVGLDARKAPVWVVTGSFNATAKAVQNLENALIISDKNVATTYFKEYERVLGISKPLASMPGAK
eukprot:m.449483 g.449483  ORF g.449483 m.449483 type:complete len:266 (+) comp56900_c0_seq24:1752-2549(+)